MTGATTRHVTVTGSIYMALRRRLKGTPCCTYASDVKLRVEANNAFYYPDVMVTCSANDGLGADGLWVLHPAAAGTSVPLASVDRTLAAEELWDELPL